MIDVDETAVARGRSAVSSSLDRLVKKEKLSAADREAALNRINGTTDYGALRKCDFVVEAATENEALKVKILGHIDEFAKPRRPWRPTPHRSRSRSSPRRPSALSASSACTSSTPCR
jgi:3-hydroxyacyl-CoA dehydrogenase